MTVKKRTYTSGLSAWQLDFAYVDPRSGRTERYRHSHSEVSSRRQAEALERKLRMELETAPDPAQAQVLDAPFGDFAGHWLTQRQVDWKPSARMGYEMILRQHLVPWFTASTMRQITAEDVQQYKVGKLRTAGQEGLAPKTVNNHLGVLSSLMSDAVKWGYVGANPVKVVRKCRPDVDAEDFNFWTAEESDAFLQAIAAGRPRWLTFFLAALDTGMRLGELAALRWEDVDFERKRLHVRRSWSHGAETRPKGGKARSLPMTETLWTLLLEHQRACGDRVRVFLSDDGGLLDSNRVKHHLWYGTKRAGVKRIRFHDLRHSFASQLVIKGVSIYKVQQLLGHSDVKTTMRYAHLSPEAEEDAVSVLERRLTPSVTARERHVTEKAEA